MSADVKLGDAADVVNFIGTWVGYVENHTFSSGSDAIKITLAPGTAVGSLQGTVVLGKGDPPPPPQDPEVGYPQGLDDDLHPYLPYEGFVYTCLSPTVPQQKRLKFTIQLEELWKAWCELQTKTYPFAESYQCVPPGAFHHSSQGCTLDNALTGAKEAVDCGKWTLCSAGMGVCSCTATSCTVDLKGGASFDLSLSGNELSSVKGLSGVNNVKLTRQ